MLPFKAFPALVWEKILEKVDNPYDKLMILMSHPDLDTHFRSEKSQWQFPAVLLIILNNYRVHTKFEFFTEFLNCRLVSYLCLKEINKYINNYWDVHLAPPSILPRNAGRFIWVEDIERFEKGNYPVTSMIENFIEVEIPMRSKNTLENDHLPKELFEERREKFLRTVGSYVKGIEINLGWLTTRDLLDNRDLIEESLNLVPDLQFLKIRWFEYVDDNVFDSNQAVTIPVLSKVKVLSIYGDINSKSGFNHFNLLQYFQQIKKLEIPLTFWKPGYNQKDTFPMLESICLWAEMNSAGINKELLHFFEFIDMPKLVKMTVYILFHWTWAQRNDSKNEKSAIAQLVKNDGLKTLKKKYPNSDWTVNAKEGLRDTFTMEFAQVKLKGACKLQSKECI